MALPSSKPGTPEDMRGVSVSPLAPTAQICGGRSSHEASPVSPWVTGERMPGRDRWGLQTHSREHSDKAPSNELLHWGKDCFLMSPSESLKKGNNVLTGHSRCYRILGQEGQNRQ